MARSDAKCAHAPAGGCMRAHATTRVHGTTGLHAAEEGGKKAITNCCTTFLDHHHEVAVVPFSNTSFM